MPDPECNYEVLRDRPRCLDEWSSIRDIDCFKMMTFSQCRDSIISREFIPAVKYPLPQKIDQYATTINAVGIDLGTENCYAAINWKKELYTLPIENTGERALSSYVAFDERTPKCGRVAFNRLRNHYDSTVFDMKKYIGKKLNEIAINISWPFKIENVKGVPHIVTKRCNVLSRTTPERVLAVLLTHIKSKIEEFHGKPVTEAVLTVPGTFTDSQKEAIKTAALLAGFQPVHFLPESVAAAFAYFIDHPIKSNSIALLVDLGASNLNVCIFKIDNNELEIINESRKENFGGRDIDQLLFDYFEKEMALKYEITKLGLRRYKLIMECQKIKIMLSYTPWDVLDIDDFDPSKEGFIKISREELEDMSKHFLFQIQACINLTLEKANKIPSNISNVLYAGGGCRMPMIKDLLTKIFPKAQHFVNDHPEEMVAIGAAYYAYSLQVNAESDLPSF